MTGRGTLWLPFALALLAGAFVLTCLPVDRAPGALVALFGEGVESPLDVYGGLRLELTVEGSTDATAQVVATLERRLEAFQTGPEGTTGAAGARVEFAGGRVVVTLPGFLDVDPTSVAHGLVRPGRLAFAEVVEDAPVLQRIAARAQDDPAATEAGIVVVRGRMYAPTDAISIVAPDRQRLERWLTTVAAGDPTLRLPESLVFGYQRTGPSEQWPDTPEEWGTLLLRHPPALTGTDLRSAAVATAEYDGRPYVALEFTAEGGAAFADLTARIVDRRLAIVVDDEVQSAPVVRERIPGGRAQITLGSGPPHAELLEAATLAGALRTGPLVAPVELFSTTTVSPRVDEGDFRSAAIAFAALVMFGVLVLGFVFRGLAGARAKAGATGPPVTGALAGAGAEAGARLFVTLAAATAVVAMGYLSVPLPGLDPAALEAAGLGATLGVFGLGILPLLSGFVVVELFALIVPPLRRLRHGGPAGRRPLFVAALMAAAVAGALQAWGIASWVEGMPQLFDIESTGLAGPSSVAFIATLTAGPFVYVVIAALAERYGLAGGFSTLLLGAALSTLAYLWREGVTVGHDPSELLVLVAAVTTLAGATLWALRGRARGDDGVALRLPAAGLVPLQAADQVIGILVLVGVWVDLWPMVDSLTPGSTAYLSLNAALVVGAALLLSALFTWRRRLAPLVARILGAPASAVDRALSRAWLPSVAYVVTVAAVIVAATRLVPELGAIDLLGAAVAAAVGLDLVDEWRARVRLGPLVPVWPLHRVQVVDVALHVLATSGIPAHVRGAGHRALLHFFGPYVPATVLVPPDHAERAHALLAEKLSERGAASESDAPREPDVSPRPPEAGVSGS